jgi:hypothetical protein
MDSIIQIFAGVVFLGAGALHLHRLLGRPARAKARPLLRRAR